MQEITYFNKFTPSSVTRTVSPLLRDMTNVFITFLNVFLFFNVLQCSFTFFDFFFSVFLHLCPTVDVHAIVIIKIFSCFYRQSSIDYESRHGSNIKTNFYKCYPLNISIKFIPIHN